MPLILLAPLAAFIFAISGIRTRRAASAMTVLGATVMLAATVLAAWVLLQRSAPFNVTYQWINESVAFSGPLNFQAFGIDIVLYADHMNVMALLVVEICGLGALLWHRSLGRNEQGPVRFHVLVSLFLFASAGVLISRDLAETVTFWGLAAAATYFLLAHRWGSDGPARSARIALVLPYLTDLSLLSGVAVLYSRYGKNALDDLLPILHTTPGWTTRQLVVASLLIFIGLAGRMAIWPLQGWVTGTANGAPAAASAMVQATWSVLAVVVLYRVLPIFVAANPQTLRACLYVCGAAMVVAPLLGLMGNEPRRLVALAGSGVTALAAAIVIHGVSNPAFTVAAAGVAIALAAAPARLAAVLAVSGISNAMRTDDMSEMGDAWKRMRASAMVLLIAVLVPAVGAAAAVAPGVVARSKFGLSVAEAIFVIALVGVRLFMATSLGPLRRRRAFEPDRVRDVPEPALFPLWLTVIAGGALTVAAFSGRWFGLLDGGTHKNAALGAYIVWLLVAVVGFGVAAVTFTRAKDAALRASFLLGNWVSARLSTAEDLLTRHLFAPSSGLAGGIADSLSPLEVSLGQSLLGSGRQAAAAATVPALGSLIILAILLAIGFGLISPGVYR